MRIVMVGTGYVGLVSGACFSDFGHDIVCVDKDATKIAALQAGRVPIFEPGLAEIVAKNVAQGRLNFTTSLQTAVKGAEAIFIAVGTPSRRGDGDADLQYVYDAAREIAAHIKKFTVIVTKSTVPVGTGDEVERIMKGAAPKADFAVVSNPEFLREGAAINDFKRPDRIIVGLEDERAKKVMTEIYRPLHINQGPLLFTDRRTSELIKYTANAYLAMKITFINEIADLCEALDANVQEVARGIGLDNRIGLKFLHAGPGFGGSCFPKDTRALAKKAQDLHLPLKLVEATIEVNEARKLRMVQKIEKIFGPLEGKRIAVLGLTFKPNTDDMREAASLDVIPGLIAKGAEVTTFDPEGMGQAKLLLNDVNFAADPYECVKDADGLVILTEWDAFRALDLTRIKKLMRTPQVADLRNIYRPDEMRNLGFTYDSVGRP
jgi:UDPglucose 6-dehydrogenase